MKIKELIKLLEEIPNKEMEIVVNDNCGGGYNMTGIDIVKFDNGEIKLEIN